VAEDNILPVEIVLIPPDAAQVRKAMSDIEAKVAASGRSIGQSTVGKLASSHVDQYYKQTSRIIKAHTKAIIEDNKRKAAQIVADDKAMRRSQEAEAARQVQYNKAWNQAILEDSKRNAAQILATEKALRTAQEAEAAQRVKMEKAWNQAIIEDNKRKAAQILAIDKQINAAKLAEQKRIAAVQLAADRAAQKELQKSSSEAIHAQAGLVSPQQRIANINAVKQAQKLATDELAKGNITLAQYSLLMKDAEKRLNLFELGNVRARGAVHQFIAKMASLTFELTGAIYGFGILAATLASPMFFGVNFLRKLEDTKFGIAAILLSMGSLNNRALQFPQALAAADEQVKLLAKDSINLSGTLDEFAKSFQAILAPGLAAGMRLDEIRKIAVAGTVAVKTIGLDAKQIVQEIRDLVAGGITAASSTLATSLGLTDADIKRAKLSSEGLFKFLSDKLDGFVKAAEQRPTTLSGKIEQTWEIFPQGLASQSKYAFDAMKDLFDLVASKIGVFEKVNGINQFKGFNPEFISNVKKVIDALTFALKVIAEVVSKLWDLRNVILAFAAAKVALNVLTLMTKAVKTYSAALAGAVVQQKLFSAFTLGGTVLEDISVVNTFSKTILSLVGKAGLIGIILWGIYEAWGWWKDRIDKPIQDARDAAKQAAEDLANNTEYQVALIKKQINELETRLKSLKGTPAKAPEEAVRNYFADTDKMIETYRNAVEKSTGASREALTKILNELITKRTVEADLVLKRLTTGSNVPNAERQNQIKNLEEALKGLYIELNKLQEPAESISDKIRRMDASLINARRSAKDLNAEFFKSYEEAAKASNAVVAIVQAQQDLVSLRKTHGATKEEEQQIAERTKQYKDAIDLLNLSLKYNIDLQKAKYRVLTANTKIDKEVAQQNYEHLKELIPLYGEQKKLLEDLAIDNEKLADPKLPKAIKEVVEKEKEYLQLLLGINEAQQEQIRNADPLAEKTRKYFAALNIKQTAQLQQHARGVSRTGALSAAQEQYDNETAALDKALADRFNDITDHNTKTAEADKAAQEAYLKAYEIYWQRREEITKRYNQDERKIQARNATLVLGDISSVLDSVSKVYAAESARQIKHITDKYTVLEDRVKEQADKQVITQDQANRKLNALEQQRVRETDAIGRKEFERQKRFQRAITIVNTASAVVRALADDLPWWARIANAAAAAAAGAAQLAVINSTSYQGGTPSTFGTTGSTGSTTNNTTNNTPHGITNIYILDSASNNTINVDDLIAQIKDRISNRGYILVTKQSSNGLELAK